ncbi:DUF917 domain-containing protein [Arthrobacter sp. VKM Ac-2550]|uniref:DUF917 domain-containing protein n=1 Tax=Crystallibacter permensis TaxID=1938888 RepID=UPI002227DED2|nr:DUF917 domain-containing protein [Arthrobacter sp. VKM Ac-2550]
MTSLTSADIAHLRTGAQFLACTIDPTSTYIYAEMIQSAMVSGQVQLVDVESLDPEDLVVATGMVTQGLFIADMPPVGDEFLSCISAIETALSRKVQAVYSLAAASINGIVPLMVGLQSGLPVVDADPMGRVFPLISQTTLHIGEVGISPIAMMGVTGERAMVEAPNPQRAETLVRSLVTELGGWAATAMYPCTAGELRMHGVRGTVTRMIRVGEILDADESVENKYRRLIELLKAVRISRARVQHIESLSRPTGLGLPAQPSSMTLIDETTGQIIRLEIQNEILLVLVDGAVAAAVPDIVTLLSPEYGTAVSLDDVGVGTVIDVIAIPAAEAWYSAPGLELAGPRAFDIPLDHPRRNA